MVNSRHIPSSTWKLCKILLHWDVSDTRKCTPLKYKWTSLDMCIHREVTHVYTPVRENMCVAHQKRLVPIMFSVVTDTLSTGPPLTSQPSVLCSLFFFLDILWTFFLQFHFVSFIGVSAVSLFYFSGCFGFYSLTDHNLPSSDITQFTNSIEPHVRGRCCPTARGCAPPPFCLSEFHSGHFPLMCLQIH